MDEREVKMLMEDVAAVMRSLVSNAVSPLVTRLDTLEKRLADMPTPKDGKDADIDEVAALAAASILPDIMAVRSMVEGLPKIPDISALVAEAVASIPKPKDGKDADAVAIAEEVTGVVMEAMKALTPEAVSKLQVEDMISRAIAGLPQPETDAEDLIKSMVAEAVAALPPAEKGKDADPAETEEMVIRHVERVLAGWERPKDGKDGAPGEKGKDGASGRDGVDVMDVVIDREGNAVFTMSDGRMKNVGLIVGRDGEPGRDGCDGAPGLNGKDGADGVGFDGMTCEIREDGVYLVWEKGEVVKEARMPIPMDRGVFKEGQTYRAGDGVTWAGSFWIAQEPTTDKPDSGKGWRLAIKKGRDGKDAPSTKPDPKKGK